MELPEFDSDVGIPILLAVVGAVIALFAVNGGFVGWPEGTGPGWITKIGATLGGAAIGVIWYYIKRDR